MVKEIDLNSPAFAPVAIESLGDRDEEVLQNTYGDASGQGIKGTLLPHSLPGGQGGSMAFSATDPMTVIVNPDIAGASYVLEPGTIKEKENGGPPPRVAAGGYNRKVVRKMADKAMREAVEQSQTTLEKEEPVAKRKVQTKRKTKKTLAVTQAEEAEASEVSTELPTRQIAFDFGPPMGTMETRYHDIYREGNRLVLAWDTNCVTASKYKPSLMEQPIKVIVGREHEEYMAYSLGIEFTDEQTGRFYIILLIDMRDSKNG